MNNEMKRNRYGMNNKKCENDCNLYKFQFSSFVLSFHSFLDHRIISLIIAFVHISGKFN